jgi:nitroreductase
MTNKECIDTIKSRCSIRKQTSDPIPDEDIETILEVGFSAPSAGNRQPWRVIVVKDNSLRQRLAEAALKQAFVAKAPVVFAVCAVPEESAARYGERGSNLYVFQDTAALTQNVLLAAHSLGYGGCWVGAFEETQVSEVLDIPGNMRPVALIPVGRFEGESPPRRQRRPLSEVVVREKF